MPSTSVVSVDFVACVVLATTPTTATHPTLLHAQLLAHACQGPLPSAHNLMPHLLLIPIL